MKMPKALGLALGGAMVFMPIVASAEPESLSRSASVELENPSALLPFSVTEVLSYFNEAFGKPPARTREKTYVYTDRENPDELAIVTVSDLETGLAVVLLATGDYGVNYMREFFEAPFFVREETEQLYVFLDRGPGVRSITLRRFKIQMSISHVGNWVVVALEFGPALIYRPELAAAHSANAGPIHAWQPTERECQELGSWKVPH